MSEMLDRLPAEALRKVAEDLVGSSRNDRGRPGLSAEQVLRVVVVKQLTGVSYKQLAFLLCDSMSYRRFCRIIPDESPQKSALQANIKRLQPETLETIHRAIVSLGHGLGIEDGRRVSVDSTAVESNIHHPTDSSLLYDCVRKLTALLRSAAAVAPVRFCNHQRRAKRRAFEIANAKSMKERLPLYQDLLNVVDWCLRYARQAATTLCRHDDGLRLSTELCHYIELAEKVHSQTWRRVFLEETVPPSEKVVSIFEPHSDILIKDNRQTFYGHKAFLTVGSSGLVLDLHVPRGNPNDSTLATELIASLKDKHGIIPDEAAFDGGFCSHDNLRSIKKLGVQAVAFTSPRGLSIEQMTGSRARFVALRKFRARIEGTIGWLKSVFGFRRCTFRGFESFRAYTWASVLSLNLLVLARSA